METEEAKREEIREVISGLKSKDFEDAEWSEDAINRLVELANKGKMFRGISFLNACEAMNGPKLVNYAAAIELLHTGLLIQDDVMDQDEMRRGSDSIHIQYQKKLGDTTYPNVGKNMAICVGDIAYFLAFELLSRSDHELKKTLETFSETFAFTGIGQMRDLEVSSTPIEPSREEIIQIYKHKTASYTFSLPLQMASVVSNGKDSEKLEEIGTKLGVLYQIVDDHLDLFKSHKITGKPDKSDIKQNKKTLHRKTLLEKVENTQEVKELLEGETTEQGLVKIVEMMKEHGVDEEIEDLIQERKEEIQSLIKEIEDEELSDMLSKTLESAVNRER